MTEIGNGLKNLVNLEDANLKFEDRNVEDYSGLEGLVTGLSHSVQLKNLRLYIGNFNFEKEYSGQELGKSLSKLTNLKSL